MLWFLSFPLETCGCTVLMGPHKWSFLFFFFSRYNNYDRAVINTVPYDVVNRWYTAHRTLTTELRRPENELWVKLKPGKVGLWSGGSCVWYGRGGAGCSYGRASLLPLKLMLNSLYCSSSQLFSRALYSSTGCYCMCILTVVKEY